jgi:hypothetical protein
MSFEDAEADARQRFAESSALLNHIRAIAPADGRPVDDLQKAQRGLWLVSIYAAVERGTNAVVEATISDISSQSQRSIDCASPVHSIFHYSKIQSIRDCSNNRLIDSSVALFRASFGNGPMVLSENPIADRLQNVDASTMEWLASVFGAPTFVVSRANVGRLSNLRERRNAVAHGREAASEAGQRFNIDELSTVYAAADEVLTAFRLHMQEFCVLKGYLRQVA